MWGGGNTLTRELEQGLRAANLPFLVVYGPRFSGKSELLERTPEVCEQFAQRLRLFCLYLDFRVEWKNPGDPVRQLQDKLIEAASRALPEFRERGAAAGRKMDLSAVIEAIAAAALAEHWGLLLLWDHFDHLPNEGMRSVSRQMKLLKESRTARAVCKRIGIIAASARNLSWLNDSKDSPFLGYEPILLPEHASQPDAPQRGESRVEQWLAGEQPLLRAVKGLRVVQRKEAGCRLDCLSRRVLSDPSGAAILGDAFLHLVSGAGNRELAEELLHQAAIAGSRSAMPDFDEFEETGLFVGGRSPARYRFRNKLFERIAHDCLEYLNNGRTEIPAAGSVVGVLDRFQQCCRRLSVAASLAEAVAELRMAWTIAIDDDIPEYYLCFEGRDGGELGWMGWRRDEALRFLASSDVPSFGKRVRELSGRQRESFVHADELSQGVWHRQKMGSATLIHMVAAPRPAGGTALNESTGWHLRRVLATHEEVLGKLAVLEYGRHSLSREIREKEVPDSMPAKGKKAAQVDARLVFIVHGRNLEAKRKMEDLLLRLELKPIEWEAARSATGKAMPSTLEIIQAGLKKAQAVVVLMTGDDRARLGEEFNETRDAFENQLTPQPRQNVLIEAGMATALYPDRTLLIEFDALRPISDFAGLNTVRYDGSASAKLTIAKRLKDAGCPVNTDGVSWVA